MATQRSPQPTSTILAGWLPPPPGDLSAEIAQAEHDLLQAEGDVSRHAEQRRARLRAQVVRNILFLLDTRPVNALAETVETASRSRISQLRSTWRSPVPLTPTIRGYIKEASEIREKPLGLTAEDRTKGRETQLRRLIEQADPRNELSAADREALGRRLLSETMAGIGAKGALSRWGNLLREVDPDEQMAPDLRAAHARGLWHVRASHAAAKATAKRTGMPVEPVEHVVTVTETPDEPPAATCACGWPARRAQRGRTPAAAQLGTEVDPDGTMPPALREVHIQALRHRRAVEHAQKRWPGETFPEHTTTVTETPEGDPAATCTCGWPQARKPRGGRNGRPTAREKLAAEVDPDGTMPPALREVHMAALRHRQTAERNAGLLASQQPDGVLVDHITSVIEGDDGPVAFCTCGWPESPAATDRKRKASTQTPGRV